MENLQPRIRFKGFYGDWEKDKLENLSKINPKSEILPKVFKYIDLESVKGTSVNNIRIENKDNAPSRAKRLAKKNDIFYQTVRPYQKNNYLYKLNDTDFVFSTGYAQIRTSNKLSSSYLFSKMQDQSFVNRVLNLCTGTSYPAISSNDLSKMKITYPCKEEQEKIGALFERLDLLIERQEKYLALNKELKKSLLQKLFPKEEEDYPELRFDGFESKWKKYRLGELSTISSNGVDKKIYKGQKIIKLLNYMDVYNKKIPNDININEFMKTSASDKQISEKSVEYGDIFITPSSETREDIAHSISINSNIENLVYSYHLIRIRPFKNKLDVNFSNYFLNIEPIRKQLIIKSQGAQRITLKQDDIIKLKIKLPSLKEQEKIGSLFKSLDDKIKNEEKKLSSYKALKKSLLQKIFV